MHLTPAWGKQHEAMVVKLRLPKCVHRCLNQFWREIPFYSMHGFFLSIWWSCIKSLFLKVEPLQLFFSLLLRRSMLGVSSYFISLFFSVWLQMASDERRHWENLPSTTCAQGKPCGCIESKSWDDNLWPSKVAREVLHREPRVFAKTWELSVESEVLGPKRWKFKEQRESLVDCSCVKQNVWQKTVIKVWFKTTKTWKQIHNKKVHTFLGSGNKGYRFTNSDAQVRMST